MTTAAAVQAVEARETRAVAVVLARVVGVAVQDPPSLGTELGWATARAPSVPSAADLPMIMVPSHDYKRGVLLMTAPAGPKAQRVGISPVTEEARRDLAEVRRGRQWTRAGGLMRT